MSKFVDNFCKIIIDSVNKMFTFAVCNNKQNNKQNNK